MLLFAKFFPFQSRGLPIFEADDNFAFPMFFGLLSSSLKILFWLFGIKAKNDIFMTHFIIKVFDEKMKLLLLKLQGFVPMGFIPILKAKRLKI